jgi:hypothetical protein
MFSAVEDIFSRITSMIASTAKISVETSSEISPYSK